MNKLHLFYGITIGLIAAFMGCYLFIELCTEYPFLNGIQILKSEEKLGKIITLGAVLNLFIFFGLLKFKKELMAKGIIVSLLLLTILTVFI